MLGYLLHQALAWSTPVDALEVYLIRHGETEWNVAGKIQGHTDIPLNENGAVQAQQLGEQLKHVPFSAVYSSDLARALKTASLATGLPEQEIKTTPLLRERHMGCFEGRSGQEYWQLLRREQVGQTAPEVVLAWRGDESVESFADVFARLLPFFKALQVSHPGETVLVSSHAHVLAALLYHVDFREGYDWRPENCAHIRLRLDGDNIEVLEMHKVALLARK